LPISGINRQIQGVFNLGIATEGAFLIRELEIIKIKAGPNLFMPILNYNVE